MDRRSATRRRMSVPLMSTWGAVSSVTCPAGREKRVKIYGEPFDVKINVEVANGYSAHGGQNFLKEYALAAKGKLRELFLVHGEQRGADGLREVLEGEGMPSIHFPERGTEMEL